MRTIINILAAIGAVWLVLLASEMCAGLILRRQRNRVGPPKKTVKPLNWWE